MSSETETSQPAAEVGAGIARRRQPEIPETEEVDKKKLEEDAAKLKADYGDLWSTEQTLENQFSKPGYFKLGNVLVEYFDMSVTAELQKYNVRLQECCNINGKKARIQLEQRVAWSPQQATHKVLLISQEILYRQLRVKGTQMSAL